MRYDLESALGRVDGEPWELELRIGEQYYPTRALSVGDIDALRSMGGLPSFKQRAMIVDLFTEPKPVLDQAPDATLSGIIAAVAGYQQGRASKNSKAIAVEVAAIATK